MVDPVTDGSLVAGTLSIAAEAVMKGTVGGAVKDGYKALREKVSQWAASDVVELEKALSSAPRQAVIAEIIDAQSEEIRISLRVLAAALVAKLKESAPAIGLDIGRLNVLEAQLGNITVTNPAGAHIEEGHANISPSEVSEHPAKSSGWFARALHFLLLLLFLILFSLVIQPLLEDDELKYFKVIQEEALNAVWGFSPWGLGVTYVEIWKTPYAYVERFKKERLNACMASKEVEQFEAYKSCTENEKERRDLELQELVHCWRQQCRFSLGSHPLLSVWSVPWCTEEEKKKCLESVSKSLNSKIDERCRDSACSARIKTYSLPLLLPENLSVLIIMLEIEFTSRSWPLVVVLCLQLALGLLITVAIGIIGSDGMWRVERMRHLYMWLVFGPPGTVFFGSLCALPLWLLALFALKIFGGITGVLTYVCGCGFVATTALEKVFELKFHHVADKAAQNIARRL